MEDFIDFMKIIGISVLIGIAIVSLITLLVIGIASAASDESDAGAPLKLVYSSVFFSIYTAIETSVCYIKSGNGFETMVNADGTPKLYEAVTE